MSDSLEDNIRRALETPQNLGEMADADAVGTAGSDNCGDMLRMWVKFREENGEKVVDKATFQAFGCQTAIAVASVAAELIRGKTPEQALALSSEELAAPLGPLPPMKIHCAQLVEEALRGALASGSGPSQPVTSNPPSGSLSESLAAGPAKKIRFL